jgi:transposase
MSKDITLTVDYHDRACVIRRYDHASRRERLFMEVPTAQLQLQAIVDEARRDAGRRGRVVWIQESTTGWARMKELLGSRVEFQLANVLQMPLPPKARRRKTDKIDTARMQREHLAGNLPLAYQPPPEWRQLRRLVAFREGLVNRQTAVRNWINRYLAHETWYDRTGLWSAKGRQHLRRFVETLPRTDALVLGQKLDELDRLREQLKVALSQLLAAYRDCPDARRLDAIRGIDVISAVSIVARIGPIDRFQNANALIAYAGLAPGVEASDQKRRDGHVGGGGTDTHLRHYLIEASVWARRLPRYKVSYESVSKRKGNKVGRLVVARMLARSIYKMLKDQVAFSPACPAPGTLGRLPERAPG